ncbi:MAG: PPC domain-containing DNA-binding protein [Elainella sp.]
MPFQTLQAVALRLQPQQDLRLELERYIHQHQLEAACIVTCVGSLTQATIRLANQPTGTVYQGRFEIVSLTGMLSVHGSHYHIAFADQTGQTLGGHLLTGSLIYTTAELVIGLLPQSRFRREPDPTTGFKELLIEDR